ncbi:probable O-glycosylation ligase, exosortase A-associated [Nitrosomonas eutropha]|uniref:Probable O-glycosylation ligase, exosortase A-associated n=2 Tax=Nitrosomonas eutropha TaxID=916 RepID=A0A1I7GSU8_9PROT|nr:probable O-glycosylation ligase, exosortase A-associated [Nitrosomonas eutropha]
MNPHRFAWGFLASAPVAAFSAGVALLGLAFTKERRSPFIGLPVTILALFVVWMTISWLMSRDISEEYWTWNRSAKIYLMIFVTLAVLQTKEHIMAFAWVLIGSLAVLGAKGGFFTLITLGNYRVWGPPDTFIAGNNEFALALIMIIPLVYFLQLQVTRKMWCHTLSVVILLCAVAALGSYSRGALVAIVAMGCVFWWRSPKKGEVAVFIFLIAIVMIPMLPEQWWGRMDTISEYQTDASAMGRINAWGVAWGVAKHHFFGAGMSYQYPDYFLLYGKYEAIVRAAHSIYFEILGNHGFIGLLLFLLLWITTYREAGWLMRNARGDSHTLWAAQLGAMAQVSLVGYAVGGAFLSLGYFDLPYNIMVLVVMAKKWVTSGAWQSQELSQKI